MSAISEKYSALAAEFSRIARGVDDWDAPTPVKEWRARDVVEHFTSWVPGFLGLQEQTPDDPTDDPAKDWQDLSDAIQALLDDPDRAAQLMDTPGGAPGAQVPVEQVAAQFVLPDVLMHTWDLARASGQEADLDAAMVDDLATGMVQQKDMLAASGQFGTPVVLDESHSPLDRLIAIIGRDPQWASGSTSVD